MVEKPKIKAVRQENNLRNSEDAQENDMKKLYLFFGLALLMLALGPTGGERAGPQITLTIIAPDNDVRQAG